MFDSERPYLLPIAELVMDIVIHLGVSSPAKGYGRADVGALLTAIVLNVLALAAPT